jgi:TonB family protein
MKRTALAIVVLFVFTICASADVAGGWRRDQAAITAQLEAQQYASARKASIKLTNRMLDRLGDTAEASRLLAATASLRASAEEGLGNADDAMWYREVAAALEPGTFKHPDAPSIPEAIFVAQGPDVKAPELIHKQNPERPGTANAIGESMVVVRILIDVDGVVRHPRIVQSPAPALAYAAFEAVRHWRFRPATLDGKPMPVRFNLTVNFR